MTRGDLLDHDSEVLLRLVHDGPWNSARRLNDDFFLIDVRC